MTQELIETQDELIEMIEEYVYGYDLNHEQCTCNLEHLNIMVQIINEL